MANSNIEQLCAYLNSNKAKAYPIENDMLVSATDFVLNGYLKMLGVVLQQPSEITEAQLSIYKRIIAGTESEKSAEDYLRMALEIKIEDFINFTSEIKDLSIKYRFILDAMILTCVSEKNKEQIQLVAEFSESLGIEKEELYYISTMAKALLCMDTTAYIDAYEIKTNSISEDVFYGYIRMLAKGCIIQNSELTIFQPSCEEEVTVEKLSRISNVHTPTIKLSNVKVNLSEYPLSFSNHKRIILDACEFTGGDKYHIRFENCEEVIINNSFFSDFNVQTIMINNVNIVRITNSTFTNCCMKHSNRGDDWKELGGVIYVRYAEKLEPILIDGCTFVDCGGRNSVNYYRSAFISNYRCNVNESKFMNCWHYNEQTQIDPENKKRTMFVHGSKATRCTYENSAAFC